ncbi:MAG: UbiA family prenyltransferase [Bacteroidetes bacterium]|nr:UbiA family prenyltransferase [Bacteroidota bacterium]
MRNYLSLIKFSHTIFALPFAIVGFFISAVEYGFSYRVFILMLLCMVFARSAAMAFNRYLDRDIDRLNPRTKIREIPAGVIKPGNALLFVIMSSLAFVITTWLINPLCFYLSPIALLVILGYSYTKQFTSLCHLVLGLGLSLAPIGAYLTLSSKFEILPLLFSGMVLFWVSGFDIIYALQDEEFDKGLSLHSIPAAIGKKKAMRISEAMHLLVVIFLVIAGVTSNLSWFYWIGAIIFTALLTYQHSLVTEDDLSRINLAFFTTNGVASVVFSGFVLLDLFLLPHLVIT